MLDILLLILLAVGLITGIISGALKQLISLAALVIGFIIACLFYERLGGVLSSIVSLPSICKVSAFLMLWIIVPIISGLVGSLLTSLLDKLFAVGLFNRFLGGIFGVAKYALVLGALIWFFSSINMIKEETMQESKLCHPLKAVPEYVYNLLKASPNPSQGGEKGAVNV